MSYERETLARCFTQLFGRLEEAFVDAALPLLQWMTLPGGAILMKQGDPPDGVYFVVRGRLRAWVDQGGARVAIGEIGRGETVGEMGVLTGAPRTATVVAVRDTVLAYANPNAFEQLLHEHPELALHMARIVIERLQRSPRTQATKPATICLLPVMPDLGADVLGEELAAALGRWGATAMETSAGIEAAFGVGASGSGHGDPEMNDRITAWLDGAESGSDFLILVADEEETGWTRRCLRQADEVLLVANGSAPAELRPFERKLCSGESAVTGARQRLVLLHDGDEAYPSGTAAWLDRRRVDGHVHLRRGSRRHLERLARIVSRNATGLVLGGGGARGFAHLGVFKALREEGVEIDYVGGTSIGAMATCVAFDLDVGATIDWARRAFSVNPTADVNLLPLVSLIRGRRLKSAISNGLAGEVGRDVDVSDAWLTLYCVAASYSEAREVVLARGPLERAVRASVSIPAALPPVPWEGELLVDGGIFNNFPTDVMASMGARRIIGVDIGRHASQRCDFDEMPGPLALLWDRIRGGERQYQVPTLGSLLVGATLLYSESRHDHACASTDLYFNPDLTGVSLLDWSAFDRTVEIGYRHAKEILGAMPISELAPYRSAAEAEARAGGLAAVH